MAFTWTSVQERAWETAKQINREARTDPNSQYARKFVGFVDAEVVVVADSLTEMMERLRGIEPDPGRCFGLDASADYDSVDYIW
jgi:hypothetical protein